MGTHRRERVWVGWWEGYSGRGSCMLNSTVREKVHLRWAGNVLAISQRLSHSKWHASIAMENAILSAALRTDWKKARLDAGNPVAEPLPKPKANTMVVFIRKAMVKWEENRSISQEFRRFHVQDLVIAELGKRKGVSWWRVRWHSLVSCLIFSRKDSPFCPFQGEKLEKVD